MKYKQIIGISLLLMMMAVACSPIGGGSAVSSAGVVKTVNGGTDWTFANQVTTESTSKSGKTKTQVSNALANSDVRILRFAPDNREHIYSVSQAGVHYTEDSANNWKLVLSKISAYDIAIDPKSSEHIYVSGLSGGHGKVLETKDRGGSWVEIYNEVSAENPVRAIAIDPNESRNIIIGLNSGNVINSTDGGKSWSLLQNFQDVIQRIIWQESGLYILTKAKGLYHSTNRGSSFTNLSGPLLRLSENRSSTQSTDDKTVLPSIDTPRENVSTFNQVAISTKDSRVMFIAANNGLYKTTNQGQQWQFIKLPLKNTNTAIQIQAVSLGNGDGVVLVAAANTVYKSLNSGSTWQVQSIATSSFIQYILVDPKLSQVAYIGLNGGHK